MKRLKFMFLGNANTAKDCEALEQPLAATRGEVVPGYCQTLALLILLLLPNMAASQDFLDKVEIHASGGWAFGQTDGNRYVVGSEEGEYSNAGLALNISAAPHENLKLVGQIFVSQDVLIDDEIEVDLDYAFAEWTFLDALKLRIGRVKHPFGIYAEIFDVGTLRPFFMLPQGIYGPQGFTAKFYDGVGFTGSHYGKNGWGIEYDIYGGEISGDLIFPGPLSGTPELLLEGFVDTGFEVTDTLGTRINVVTPIDGLRFGFSAYKGNEIFETADVEFDRDVYAGHVEYRNMKLTVRGEYGHFENGDRFEEDGAYLEVAYKIDSHWEVAGRWDWWEAEIPGIDTSAFPDFFQQILRHRDLGIGLNYWFTESFVLRLDFHMVESNRYAFPDDPAEVFDAIVNNSLEDKTELLVFGAHFSF